MKVTEEGQSSRIKIDKVQTGVKKDSTAAAAAAVAAPSLTEYANSDASPPSISEVLYAIGNKYFSVVLGSVIALLSIVAFVITNSSK
jgi:hypothetical protein